jgi:hypothetical protein
MAALGTLRDAYRSERAVTIPKTPRTPVLIMIGTAAARLAGRWSQVRTAMLSIPGFGLISYGGYQAYHPAGYAIAGLSLLVLEWMSGDSDQSGP